jgi:hypothetical protein
MRYLNPSLVMPQYGDTGKFGALIVVTRHFKIQSEAPPQKMEPAAWITVKYVRTIDNHLSSAKKDRQFRKFAVHSDSAFIHKKIERFVYLERLAYSTDLQYYLDAIKSRGDVAGSSPVVLSPVYDSYANKNGNVPFWTFASMFIGSGLFLLIIGLIRFKPGVLRQEDNDKANA